MSIKLLILFLVFTAINSKVGDACKSNFDCKDTLCCIASKCEEVSTCEYENSKIYIAISCVAAFFLITAFIYLILNLRDISSNIAVMQKEMAENEAKMKEKLGKKKSEVNPEKEGLKA